MAMLIKILFHILLIFPKHMQILYSQEYWTYIEMGNLIYKITLQKRFMMEDYWRGNFQIKLIIILFLDEWSHDELLLLDDNYLRHEIFLFS